jgi:hypothetical protein
LVDDPCYDFLIRGNLGLFVCSADRAHLAAIVADRSSRQKHVWRAQVVLLTGDRVGTAEIMRQTGLSKPSMWRWQQRYVEAGVDGLLRDKTRPSRIPKLADERVAWWIPSPSAEAVYLGKSDLDVFAKAFEEGLDRGQVAEAFARCEIEREDDLLEVGLAQGVEVEMPRQLSSEPPIGVLDAAFLP